MDKFIIKSYFYNEATLRQRKEIAELLDLVWENNQAELSIYEPPVTHRKELLAQCFCCYLGDILVGYAAVIRKDILHCGDKFTLAGLSCVATHPDYRHRGIGSKIVSEASQYIFLQKDVDFGIFTCQPSLASFYQNVGFWEICSSVILLGSNAVGALSSQSLNVVVLMKLFSNKAKAHKASFFSKPICLDFPLGEFI